MRFPAGIYGWSVDGGARSSWGNDPARAIGEATLACASGAHKATVFLDGRPVLVVENGSDGVRVSPMREAEAA